MTTKPAETVEENRAPDEIAADEALAKYLPGLETREPCDALMAQVRFGSKPESDMRDLMAGKAKELLAALHRLIRHRATKTDGSVTWTLENEYGAVGVTVDLTARPTAIVTREGATMRLQLAYDIKEGCFESVENARYTAPGKQPKKRNALEVILEACDALLGDTERKAKAAFPP